VSFVAVEGFELGHGYRLQGTEAQRLLMAHLSGLMAVPAKREVHSLRSG
jgi:hypothetical protein